jgi:hypothetical protein
MYCICLSTHSFSDQHPHCVIFEKQICLRLIGLGDQRTVFLDNYRVVVLFFVTANAGSAELPITTIIDETKAMVNSAAVVPLVNITVIDVRCL